RARRCDVTLVFLGTWAALLFGRSMWLREPVAVPIHRLESGALILFAFFMISDPKTTPDSRVGRMLFAGLVAAGAYVVQFVLFRTNGFLWSLAVASLLVPVIDWLLPGRRYRWPSSGATPRSSASSCRGAPSSRKGRSTSASGRSSSTSTPTRRRACSSTSTRTRAGRACSAHCGRRRG